MRVLMGLLLVAMACLWPQRAVATPPPATSVLQYCLDNLSEDAKANGLAGRACIGAAVRECMADMADRETTATTVWCYEYERSAWREFAQESADALRAQESASQIALLDQTFAAFDVWLQTRCGYDASIYEGGSLARVVAAACANRLQGELAVDLGARLAERAGD